MDYALSREDSLTLYLSAQGELWNSGMSRNCKNIYCTDSMIPASVAHCLEGVSATT